MRCKNLIASVVLSMKCVIIDCNGAHLSTKALALNELIISNFIHCETNEFTGKHGGVYG